MDHPIGLGEQDARRCCKRARQPVLDKGSGKNGTVAKADSSQTRSREDK